VRERPITSAAHVWLQPLDGEREIQVVEPNYPTVGQQTAV
jgi:hypothetical protein